MADYGDMPASAPTPKVDLPPMPDPVWLAGDMPLEMKTFAFEAAKIALGTKKVEKDQATELKKAMEAKYNGCWHCIVGKSFGASITNETLNLGFFRIGLAHLMVFRTLDLEAHAAAHAAADEAVDGLAEDGDDGAGEGGEGAAGGK